MPNTGAALTQWSDMGVEKENHKGLGTTHCQFEETMGKTTCLIGNRADVGMERKSSVDEHTKVARGVH